MNFVLLIGGLALVIPLALVENAGAGALAIAWMPGLVLGILYLGIVSTAVAMLLWNYAFARMSASTAGLALFAQPVVGAGLSALLLDANLGWPFLFGGILIGLGVWLSVRENTNLAKV